MDDSSLTAPSRQAADRDLAIRSKLSGMIYVVLYAIILLFTSYASDHTLLAILIGSLILFGAALRSWLAFDFERLYPALANRWSAGFGLSTYLLAGTWGLFCAHSVLHYGLAWTAMLTVLSTAGICSGAITVLTIRKHLITGFLALILFPPIIATALLGTSESFAITLMFLTYSIFMFSIARNVNRDYWTAATNAQLLDLRARQLEASNQELESYSYSIAHDMRAPLRSIISFSQILKESLDRKLEPEERRDLDRIIHAGQRMASLIDDILELSRITRSKLQPGKIDLSGLVQDRVDVLASTEPGRSINITVEPELSVLGDQRLLSLAIQNLVENAWKFTGDTPDARIVFNAKEVDGELVYCLCDNGVGFDMAHADQLFRPFHRLHNDTEFPGTGIGLATVERIITRHGGRIWAEADLNKGACFYFTLKQD